MYERADTWLPSAQSMGLGQITFDHLRRAARRSRGVGATYTMGGSIPPTDSPCYNRNDIFPHFLGYAGADENQCLAGQLAAPNLQPVLDALMSGPPVGYNPQTGTVDASNTTGATQGPDPGVLAAAWQQVAASLPSAPTCGSDNWFCTALGIGCQNPGCANTGGSPGMTGFILAAVGITILALYLRGGR